MSDDWTPVHHEDAEPEPEQTGNARPMSGQRRDNAKEEPAIILTFPPHMITGIWALSEALEKNTEALKEHTEELRKARSPHPET